MNRIPCDHAASGCNYPEGDCTLACCHKPTPAERDAELGAKVRAMLCGGQFDLSDSPRSFLSACQRIVEEQRK